jgi:Protein of unknown function (DUF1269)
MGISDEFIDEVKQKVTPGTSALSLLTDDTVVDKVESALKDMNAHLIASNLSAEQEKRNCAMPSRRLKPHAPYSLSERITNPVLSFGVKNVDLGGINRPSRAVRSISATLTGRIRTAAEACPLSTPQIASSRPCW